MSIFDLVLAQEITAHWNILVKDEPPYVGESLWPAQKKMGLDLKYLLGAQGLPIVLKPSAFDAKAIPRDRIGFEKLSMEMPFFKESTYIDEVIRQELNIVLETGNSTYIDYVMNRIFNDQMTLLRGARAQRERLRMMALTTGAIDITANGENLKYDYQMPAENKVTTAKNWSDPAALIIDEIRTWQDKIEDLTGSRPTRGMCSRKTWGYFTTNSQIRATIFVNSNGLAPALSDAQIQQYLMQQLGISINVNTKRYLNEAKASMRFIPDDLLVMFPEGDLGNTWFGTTPEESDLMSGTAANVSITDTGVAVTTIQHTDPVNVETKVTMICLPSFEAANKVLIADLTV